MKGKKALCDVCLGSFEEDSLESVGGRRLCPGCRAKAGSAPAPKAPPSAGGAAAGGDFEIYRPPDEEKEGGRGVAVYIMLGAMLLAGLLLAWPYIFSVKDDGARRSEREESLRKREEGLKEESERESKRLAGEAATVMRRIARAEESYRKKSSDGRCAEFDALVRSGLVEKRLLVRLDGKYELSLALKDDGKGYAIEASPCDGIEPKIFLYLDETGAVRQATGGKAAPDSPLFEEQPEGKKR